MHGNAGFNAFYCTECCTEPFRITRKNVLRSCFEIRRNSIYQTIPCNGVLHGREKRHVAFPPRLAVCAMDSDAYLGYSLSMSADNWNRKSILRFLAEGCTLGEAARLLGVHRQTLLRWRWESPEFAESVAVALATGKDERTYRMWLRHPFRGIHQLAKAMAGVLASPMAGGDFEAGSQSSSQLSPSSYGSGSTLPPITIWIWPS